MTVWNYVLETLKISNFKYFQTVRQKSQIHSFCFWENLQRANLLTILSGFYKIDSFKHDKMYLDHPSVQCAAE